MKKRTVAALLACSTLVGVPAASAKSPNDTQYGNRALGVAAEKVARTPTPTPVRVQNGTLPFTGTDLAITFLAGAGAVAGGFGLRRLGRRPADH